jgi:hypothetical protein
VRVLKTLAIQKIARLIAIALLATACGGGKGGSSSSSSHGGAPSLSYATNPLALTIDVAAAPDLLQVNNSAKALSISPALPAGLSFDAITGTISGTPTAITASANYIVTATNSYGSNFVNLQLAVNDVLPTITYGGPSTIVYTVGSAISSITPTLGGGTTTNCVSTPSLPPGISLSAQCVISGTPTQPVAATNYTIAAQNSGGAASFALTITVQDILPAITYSPSSLTLDRGIAMSSQAVSNSGGAIVSCSSTPSLPSGIILSSTCQISGTPTAISSSTAYTVTATNSGGTSNATINIGVVDLLPAISFSPLSRVLSKNTPAPTITATNAGGLINSCTVSPPLPAGLSISSATCQVSGTPTVISASTLYTFTATNGAGSTTAQLTLTVDDIVPAIHYSGSPYVFANLASISAVSPANSGGPIVSCTSSPSLPAALSISSSCVISGTPSAASAATNYTITATNSGGLSSQTISITISQIAPIINYSSGTYTFNKSVPIAPQSVTNTGGPITSCAVIPSLPTGLSLSTSTCAISGTPTVAIASSNYTVTATNSAGSSSVTLAITVTDSPPAFSYPSSPYVLNLNQTVSTITPSSTGGVIASCSSSPTLPTGLALSSSCGISGTPTALSAATAYTITATNAGGSSTAPVNLSIVDHAPVISYAGSPYNFPLSAAITAQSPANTGGTPTSCSSSPTLPTGLALSAGCVLSGTPTALSAATSYTITGTNTGGSGSAAVVIAVSSLPVLSYSGSPFSFTLGTSVGTITPTNSGAAVTSCSSSPSLPSNLSLSSACAITGTPSVVASAANYTITATNASGNSNVGISIQVTGPPILSYSNSPFTFVNGTSIAAQTPVNTGSPATSCSASPALPSGLSLSSSCVLSGTAAVIGTGTYTVTGTNAAGSGTASITVTINDLAPAISYAGSPYTFNTGSAITSQTPANTGGAIVSCASTPTLPTGLALSSACVLSGTPTANSASTSYTITATNSGGSAAAAIVIAVSALPSLTYSGSPYSFTLSTSVGTITPTNAGGAVTSCTSSPTLPAGLSLASNCSFSGTPTAVTATTSYTITAVNASGSANVNISITVTGAPVLSYTTAPFFFTKGSAISAQTPSNSGSTPTSCSSSPTLPAGLALSTACVLSGTPTAVAALTSYTITGTNTAGSGSVTIGITVNDVAPNISYSGSPYSFAENGAIATQTPANTGGTIISCTVSPTLPTGLSLSSTCVLTGTPTVLSSATSYTIVASNSGGNFPVAISIAVNSAPVLSFSGSPFSFTLATSVGTITPTNSGGPVNSCTVSPTLPAGLSLANNCVISGTPTAIATNATYTLTATNTSASANISVSIEVLAAPVLSYSGTPFTFTKSVAISAQTPANAGSPATSCSSSPTLPAGISLSAACVISGTPTAVHAASAFTITGTNSVGSGTASINVTVINLVPAVSYAGSPYNFSPSVAITSQTPSNTGGAITSCSSSPTLPTGLALSTACVLSGTPTVLSSATSYTITATNTGGSTTTAISIAVTSAPALTYSGSPYSFTVGTSAGTITPTNTGAAVTSCSISPALPSGLSLSGSCVLSGTPTVASATGNYSVTATNSSGTTSVNISITVTGTPALTYSGAPFTFTSGTAITAQTPSNTGSAATSCSSSPTLPTGLTLSTSCILSGTATTPSAAASYTISATNSAGTGTVAISITVLAAAPNIAYAGSPYQFPTGSAIASKTPSNTGGTIVSCASSPTLPTGLALSSVCVLSGTPTVETSQTSYTITATNTGGTSSASIVIGIGATPALTYSGSPFSFTVGTSAGTITPTNAGSPATSCTSSPALPSGISLSAACVLSGTPTISSASASYAITATNSAGSSAVTIVIAVTSKPILTYGGSPFVFTNGTSITSQTPTNTGDAATSCSSSPTLPAGLALSNACILSGTPTATSTATTYTISGVNATGTGTTTISITVSPAVPNISYAGSPYNFIKSTAITSQTPANTGGTITSCSSSPTLPTGLAISATCVISGTPTATTASTSYTITATNAGGSGTVAIVVAVGAAPALTYSGSPFSYTVGTAITAVTPTNTGSAPTSCTVSPTLPGGLTITSACVLSGTPTIAASSAIYTLTATNSFGTQNPTITIAVLGPPIITYPDTPYTFKQGTTIGPVAVSNTGSPATSCSSSPTLPTGLSLSTTCTISGTPAGLTSNTYTITGTNSKGNGSTSVSITVTLTGMFRQLAQTSEPSILFYSKMSDSTGATHPWTVTQSGTNLGGTLTEISSALTSYGVDYDFPPVYSPDGTKIAFVTKTPLADGSIPLSYNLWIMNLDGTNRLALTQNLPLNEDSFNPTFSPDSLILYFQSKAPVLGVTSQSSNIWKVDVTGANLLPLTSQTGLGLDSTQPDISPDGKSIAFTSSMPISGMSALSTNIWTMDTAGGSLEPLTLNTASLLNSRDPSFSPDGSMILFSSQQIPAGGTNRGVMDIWEMQVNGSPQIRLTNGNADSGTPQMSPDQTGVVFTSKMSIGVTPSASSNVWEMNADGSSERYLTGNTSQNQDSFFQSGSVWVQTSP